MNEKFMKLCRDYGIEIDIHFDQGQKRWIIRASRFNELIKYRFSEEKCGPALYDVWDEVYDIIYDSLVTKAEDIDPKFLNKKLRFPKNQIDI